MKLHELTIVEARKKLDAGQCTAVELTQACFDQIHARNPEINAFITLCEEEALAEAQRADEMIAKGEQTMLTGIPYGAKDAICTKGVRSTGAAHILDTYIPPHDATVIARLREQGAVLLGKQNCDAFGHGASNENSMYGPVKNPLNLGKVAGGSSGGSAAAVADHMCIFSIAEDTGGSIRQPASFCGIAGLRPSYGRNSRYGIMPMASSLDTVGPMAKTVEDLAIIMEAIAGHDEKDATSLQDDVPPYRKMLSNVAIAGKKIGIPKEYIEAEGLDPEVKAVYETAIERLKEMGCEIVSVSLPHTKYAVAAYYIIVPCEDSSNLARLDGIRYGVQAEHETLYDAYAKSRAQGFPEEVKRRIMIGTYALSAGYYDAYYRKAQQVRTLIAQDFDHVFEVVDLLLTPTSPFPAFDIDGKKHDLLAMYTADIFVSPASLAGIPGLNINGGETKDGLPIGLQILGPRMSEGSLLALGAALS